MVDYPVTLYYTREFKSDNFRQVDTLGFCSTKDAVDWVNGVNKNKRCAYRVIEHSFQKYWRD